MDELERQFSEFQPKDSKDRIRLVSSMWTAAWKPTKKHVYVRQWKRFDGDLAFWKGLLGKDSDVYEPGGTANSLAFLVRTGHAFDAFVQAAQRYASGGISELLRTSPRRSPGDSSDPERKKRVDSSIDEHVRYGAIPEVDGPNNRQNDSDTSYGERTSASGAQTALTYSFNAEFAGKRKPYAAGNVVESEVRHGEVVNALQSALIKAGAQAYNTGAIDLYLGDPMDMSVTHILEVKTDTSTTNLYGAVGQLMMHSVDFEPVPKRILIVPAPLHEELIAKLSRIGIAVASYSWNVDGTLETDLKGVV